MAARLDGEELERFLKGLPAPVRRTVEELWFWQRHGGQEEPLGDWEVWLVMAGRGFGKTRAGAEWVWARVRETPGAAVALVGGTVDEAVQVMIEGESGLLACARAGEEARWVPSRRRVDFSNGATGFVYSGERPDGKGRGSRGGAEEKGGAGQLSCAGVRLVFHRNWGGSTWQDGFRIAR
jgi:hypothetical protein